MGRAPVDVCVFAPLAWERAAVVAGLARCRPAGVRRWHGVAADGRTVLLLQTGVGPRHAETAAAAASPARCFVVCGCAGALAPGLRPGDVVLADSVRDADTSECFPTVTSPLSGWQGWMHVPITKGAILTTAAPLGGAAAKRAAAAGGEIAVDMESAAVARVAAARAIPLVVLRVVLDTLDDPLPSMDVLDAASGEVRLGAALAHFLPPSKWGNALRLSSRQRVAARALRRISKLILGLEGPRLDVTC